MLDYINQLSNVVAVKTRFFKTVFAHITRKFNIIDKEIKTLNMFKDLFS